MFAAADDFADVLERNADTASAVVGTLDDVRNTDKASEYSSLGNSSGVRLFRQLSEIRLL